MNRSSNDAYFRLALPALFAAACGAAAQPQPRGTVSRSPTAETSAEPQVAEEYKVTNLVSDGYTSTAVVDPHLVNGWGLAASATGPWWTANNGTGTSSLLTGSGNIVSGLPFIDVPGDGGPGAPTGIVFYGGKNFVVSGKTASGPARFIFAGEDGIVSGWNPRAAPRAAIVAVRGGKWGAVYKGLAVATTSAGDRLFATDFYNARVDVFDENFNWLHEGTFVDPGIPEGYAPFGIQTIGQTVYVTYARQDSARHDNVAGRGLGYVSAFSVEGTFLGRVASRHNLNAPWGVAQAPAAGFGINSGKLLVGNFGDGRILAFAQPGADDEEKDAEGEFLEGEKGPIAIDGLWGIAFGFGNANSGPGNWLYFAAGPKRESHGLFGYVAPAAAEAP